MGEDWRDEVYDYVTGLCFIFLKIIIFCVFMCMCCFWVEPEDVGW